MLVHEGQASAGHYWAYIYDHANQRWMKYNDINISESSWEELERDSFGGMTNASAYCLMYIDDRLPNLITGLSPDASDLSFICVLLFMCVLETHLWVRVCHERGSCLYWLQMTQTMRRARFCMDWTPCPRSSDGTSARTTAGSSRSSVNGRSRSARLHHLRGSPHPLQNPLSPAQSTHPKQR